MNTDFRVAVDFFSHHKARKLKKRLGADGVMALLQLWAYAAKLRTDGDLSGMSVEDIELAAYWDGEDGALVTALHEVGFLDLDEASYTLHDWLENNAWAAGAESRSDASRLSRMARTYPNEYRTLVEAGVKGIGKEDYELLRSVNDRQTIVERLLNVHPSPAPSPAPSPSPAPNAEEKTVGPKDGPPPQRGFSGFTIYHQGGAMHISQRDFDSWERAYSNIDLRAELQKLSDWTKATREWGKKEAFHACSAALAKKNGAAFEAHREQSRPAAMYAVN